MYSIAGIELNAESYSQILRWSKDLEIKPDELINSFLGFSIDALIESSSGWGCTLELESTPKSAMRFEVRDGKIVRLVWDATKYSAKPLSEIMIDSLESMVVFGDTPFENINSDQFPDHCICINQPSLEVLVLYKAGVSEIDIQHAPVLKRLICPYNCIREINFEKITCLSHLVLDENPIEIGFQVALTQLEVLSLSYDADMDIFDEKILDVSKLTRLQQLGCCGYGIKQVLLPLSQSLVEIHLDANRLSYINTESTPKLKHLSCSKNELTKINTLALESLLILDCSHNMIDFINVTKNRRLIELHIYGNNIRDVDLSNNDLLIVLNCGSNPLHSIDVSGQIFLQYLSCFNTPLDQLILNSNTELKSIECRRTNVKKIDIRNSFNVVKVKCNPEVVIERSKE